MKIGKDQQGLTLIELLIVMMIIAILATVAYPTYQNHVKKTQRIAMQAELLNLSSQLQRYKIANFTFFAEGIPITLANLNYTLNNGSLMLPQGQNPTYSVELNNVTANTWTLVATPINNQLGDGFIVLNHRGERCWDKGIANTNGTQCEPTASTDWIAK
jgi:type IV pilus assembly protein PilE